jgi:hypothetical protein
MLPASLPQSTGAVFYVSTSGSDANPGTLAAPWATVQKALNTLLPGQTALVRAGTYSANLVMNRAGTATAPITVKNYPGERPVLQPASSAPTYAIRITKGAAWFRLHGFVIQNAPSGYDNIWISDGQDYTSRYPTHDIEISGNEIRNGLWTGLLVSPNVYNAEIIGNYVHNNGDWVSQHHGLYIQGQHCLVADNVVAHHYGFGIQVRGNYPDSDTATRIAATGNLITNNTVTDSQTYSGILVENNAQQTTIVNNITAYNGSYGVRGYYNGDGEWLSGNKAFGNLSYGNGSGNYGDTQGTIIDYSGGNLLANPLFVDRTGSNFHLQSGSPAIGVGLAPYAPLFDMDGNLRSPAPDVGAY